MNKNIGSFLAFNELWFKKNQRLLLWLTNTPIIKIWFRRILRISQNDCSLQTRITEVYPNRFSYGDRYFKKMGEWHIERITDFRTHPKFGKRIYYAFRPLWWLIHFWDWAFADRFIPQWSYGFDTLTAYPNPHPESTSVDGWTEANPSGTSWANLIANAGTGANDSNTDTILLRVRTNNVNLWDVLVRSVFLFDTSALTGSATISAAVMSLYGTGKGDSASITMNSVVVASAPASNTALVAGDFDSFGSTDFSNRITYAGFSASAYNDYTLNASGIPAISKTGISKLGIRNGQYDVDAVAPSHPGSDSLSSQFTCYFADQTGTSNDPKLVVTYITSTDYPLTADYGAFILTGQALLLNSVRRIVAAVGSFVLSGQSAAVSIGKGIAAAVGTFTLTGQNVVINLARSIVAAYGSFTLTGQNLTFYIARILTVTSGIISVSWQTFRLLLNGFLAIYKDKYTTRDTNYDDKHTTQGTSYEDKYTKLG